MDHPTLKDIQKPIKEELSQFESYFKQSLKSKVALLDKIMYYIVPVSYTHLTLPTNSRV